MQVMGKPLLQSLNSNKKNPNIFTYPSQYSRGSGLRELGLREVKIAWHTHSLKPNSDSLKPNLLPRNPPPLHCCSPAENLSGLSRSQVNTCSSSSSLSAFFFLLVIGRFRDVTCVTLISVPRSVLTVIICSDYVGITLRPRNELFYSCWVVGPVTHNDIV